MMFLLEMILPSLPIKIGEAITLFIGERRENGEIKGEMYERREKMVNGVKKTHWDNKGKVVGNL